MRLEFTFPPSTLIFSAVVFKFVNSQIFSTVAYISKVVVFFFSRATRSTVVCNFVLNSFTRESTHERRVFFYSEFSINLGQCNSDQIEQSL